MSEDNAEYLEVLLRQVAQVYGETFDYISAVSAGASPGFGEVVTEGWRRKLCEWCYEVVDHFGFDREVVSIAFSYLDRSMAARSEGSNEPVGRREFQLLAVTSLYLALKIHGESEEPGGPRRKLRIDAFVELSRGYFTVDAIENMERKILSSLNWRLNPPTSLKMVLALLQFFPKEYCDHEKFVHYVGCIYDIARYLCELSVCVSTFSLEFPTTTTGYASILCAIEALESCFPVPYGARVQLQNSVAAATGLLPNHPDILRAREMLRELCPNVFPPMEDPNMDCSQSTVTSASNLSYDQVTTPGSNKSPVSVIDSLTTATAHNQKGENAGRKRVRGTERRLMRSNF